MLLLLGTARPSFGQPKAHLFAAADTFWRPVEAAAQRITYAAVVPQAGVSAAKLCTRGKLWFATLPTSAG